MILFTANFPIFSRMVSSLSFTSSLQRISGSSFVDNCSNTFFLGGNRSYRATQCLSSGKNNNSRPGKTDHLRRNANMNMKSGSGPRKIRNRPELYRADRVLANRGWGTRSESSEVLKQKRVKVQREDGKTELVKGPSDRIGMDDPIFVDGKKVPVIPLLQVYHKPKWVLSVMNDPKGRPTVKDSLSDFHKKQDLHPVGRLDYDTSGLLLFSSNGGLTQKLLHPSHDISKEYVAVVEGIVDDEKLKAQLQEGVETGEGTHTGELLEVSHLPETDSRDIWKTLRETLPQEYDAGDLEKRGYLKDNNDEPLSRVRLAVSEGKHRMIRRMLANCGHGVVLLHRERQGKIVLGDLEPDNFRDLTPDELEWAKSLVPTTGKKSKGNKK